MNRGELKAKKRAELQERFNNSAWQQRFATLTLDDKTTIEGREILLPLSPSDDRRLQPTRQGRLINTFEYRSWLVRASSVLTIHQLAPYPKEVPLFVWTLVVMPNARSDHHNYQKALYDSFEQSGCVLTNDRQIVERHTVGKIIKGYAFTLSYIFPATVRIPALTLPPQVLANVLERIDEGKR